MSTHIFYGFKVIGEDKIKSTIKSIAELLEVKDLAVIADKQKFLATCDFTALEWQPWTPQETRTINAEQYEVNGEKFITFSHPSLRLEVEEKTFTPIGFEAVSKTGQLGWGSMEIFGLWADFKEAPEWFVFTV